MPFERPGWDEYYMGIARAVGARSTCIRRRVGALVVVEKAIISTGYNGTPMGVANCSDGGCPRCASDAPLRPCFGCAKESIQAGIREIVFDEPYEYGAVSRRRTAASSPSPA